MKSMFLILLGTLFVFTILHVEGLPRQPGSGRIVNGTDADLNEFPWMALITEELGIAVCGGSLITPRHVLTAAHCVLGVNEETMKKIRIRLGEHDRSTDVESPHIVLRVVKVTNHPLYKPLFEQDFSILELEEEVPISSIIHPICLVPKSIDLVGKDSIVAGWGLTTDGGLPSNILQKTTVPILDSKKCEKIYKSNGHPSVEISESMLCAGGFGPDACQRDSGSPLVWQDDNKRFNLVGVVSWGEDCGSEFPGVYSRITYAETWIQYVVNQTITCPLAL